MIEYSYIAPFKHQEMSFEGAHCFSSGGRSLLLSSKGTSIIIDDELVDYISVDKLSEDLAFKLFQRGFCIVYNHDRIQEQKEPLPTFFMIDFTTKCNCNCIYCLRHFEGYGESISQEQLEQIVIYIINYCKKYGLTHISFQPWGGEPLIEINAVIECKKMFEKAGIQADFVIQTNGLLLSLHNYELLRKHDISVGVSLDGIDIVHDKHRLDLNGEKTHNRVLKNIKAILSAYPDANIGILSVNSAFSKDHVAENVDFLVNSVGLHSIKFNLVHPSGTSDFDESILLKENEIDSYIHTLLDAVIRENEIGHFCCEANITDKLNNIIDRFGNNICNSRGCCGGISFISFDRTGNIFPCEMIGRQEFCLGSIFEGESDLLELIHKAKKNNPFYAPREIEHCDKCPYYPYCKGGCKASCLAYGKQPHQIDDIECALNKSIYPRLIELILTKPKLVERMIGCRVTLE